MDDRPIRVRTDESADTFWSRVRTSNDYSPNFRLLPQAEDIQRLTPFGRQNPPRLNPMSHVPAPSQLPMLSSRSVERMELRKGIRDAEMDKQNAMRANPCASAPHVAKKLTSSRSVERAVMQRALCDQEENEPGALGLVEENVLLKRRIAHLEKNLERALRINHALTHNMLKKW
jgi:hypothetical protein